MAAAAIPIITAAIPLLTPLITSLAIHVEHLFGKGSGPTKFDNVLAATMKAASDLGAAGKIPGQLDPQSGAMLVQNVVNDLKAQGVLTPEVAGQIVPDASRLVAVAAWRNAHGK